MLGHAINASLDAIYVMAAVRNQRGRIIDFRIADANARGLRLIGARRHMLVDRSATKLLPVLRKRGFFADYVRVVQSGESFQQVVLVYPPWRHAKWKAPKYLHRQVIRLGDGVLVTVRDVTSQKKAELVLRELPRHISRAQEAERRRVARELHDGVTQLLLAARFRLDAVQRSMAGLEPASQRRVREAAATLQRALDEARRISHALRPRELDDIGLVAAVTGLLAEFRARTGIDVQWRKTPHLPVPPLLAETFYRIAQEALTNIERHASARRVWLTLGRHGSTLRLTIADDGHGVRRDGIRASTGLGLLHMRERAEGLGGSLLVAKRGRGGTCLTAAIPRSSGAKTPRRC